jgi:ribosomal protein L30E
MFEELKRAVESEKVFFGIKQALKNPGKIKNAYISSDSREQIRNLLKMNKIPFEVSDLSKDELAGKLEIDFKCEVFALKK